MKDTENAANQSETADECTARTRTPEISPPAPAKVSFSRRSSSSQVQRESGVFLKRVEKVSFFSRLFFFLSFLRVRTFLEESDRQLRENQSKWDILHLISCLEGLVILSRGAGAKR